MREREREERKERKVGERKGERERRDRAKAGLKWEGGRVNERRERRKERKMGEMKVGGKMERWEGREEVEKDGRKERK